MADLVLRERQRAEKAEAEIASLRTALEQIRDYYDTCLCWTGGEKCGYCAAVAALTPPAAGGTDE